MRQESPLSKDLFKQVAKKEAVAERSWFIKGSKKKEEVGIAREIKLPMIQDVWFRKVPRRDSKLPREEFGLYYKHDGIETCH